MIRFARSSVTCTLVVLAVHAGAPAVLAQASCPPLTPTISGTSGDDDLLGTDGNDIIAVIGGNNIVDAAAGNDLVCGGPGDDELSGGDGDDVIYGIAGSNQLFGGPGDDVLYGGSGQDVCDGGEGINAGDRFCDVRVNLHNDSFRVTLFAPDGTPLDGELFVPTGAALAGIGPRAVAVVVRHGAQGNWTSAVPQFFGLHAIRHGVVVLSLNGRDWGPDAGGGNTLFEDTTLDYAVGIDFLEKLGFDQVFIAAHSGGTGPAAVYPGLTSDPRLAGVGLYGAVIDGRVSVTSAIFNELAQPGLYDSYVALAEQLVAAGQGEEVIGWMTVFEQEVFRSPRTFLSYWGPDTLQVADREIANSHVPVFLLRAAGDGFTPNSWSVAIRDAALAAGVDATYIELPYPFAPGFVGGNAHSFFGIERRVVDETFDWLATRSPAFASRLSNVPARDGSGNYLPIASAGRDFEVSRAETTSASLNGSNSLDLDGEIVSYSWVQLDGPDAGLQDAGTPTPSFNVPAGEARMVFQLTVTDDQGATASDTVEVTVTAVPRRRGSSALDPFSLLLLTLAMFTAARPRYPARAAPGG
ncbi:MAG: hypothetical protein JJT85_08060 [Chromatiales bacterium]|nr:hypothetical protein [Chromatiales bacterium]